MKITRHPYAPGKFSCETYLRSRLRGSCTIPDKALSFGT